MFYYFGAPYDWCTNICAHQDRYCTSLARAWNDKLHHIMTNHQSTDDHATPVKALRKESKPRAAALEHLRALVRALYMVGNRLHFYMTTENTSKPIARTEQRHTLCGSLHIGFRAGGRRCSQSRDRREEYLIYLDLCLIQLTRSLRLQSPEPCPWIPREAKLYGSQNPYFVEA